MYQKLNNVSRRLLPRWAYTKLIGQWDNAGLKKYFHNTGWFFFGRIATFAISFFTIAFVARYLGPENLGRLSYAQGFIAIFSMFASLGIDQVVYRDLVASPEREGEILGTAVAMKFFFGILTFIGTIVIAFFINPEPILTWLIALIALSFIFQPFGVVGHIFNARVMAKYPAYVAIVVAVLIPLLKLLVIYFDKGILYFALIVALEAFVLSAAYLFLYWYVLGRSLLEWRFSLSTFTSLAHDSWPLMLVGVTGYLYLRIDQVMIQHFIDSTSVGLYEVAVRLTEPLGFIPGVIIGSLFPALINAQRNNQAEYRRRLRSLTALCLGISSILALILFAAAPLLVHILFGEAFSASVPILRIYVWSTVGTIATMLMYNYFIAENRTYIQLIFTFSGAVLNVLLNLILIPKLGITGAAYATLITVTSIVSVFVLLRHRL